MKFIDEIKMLYQKGNRSYFNMSLDELLLKRKRIKEDKMIFFINALLVICFGGYFFFMGFQHISIILYGIGNLLLICLFFLSQDMNSIDWAIFVKEELINGK